MNDQLSRAREAVDSNQSPGSEVILYESQSDKSKTFHELSPRCRNVQPFNLWSFFSNPIRLIACNQQLPDNSNINN